MPLNKPSFIDFVWLCQDATHLIQKVKRARPKNLKINARRPSSLMAGMVYILAQERGFDVTQRELGFIYGCVEKTVKENVQLLRDLIKTHKIRIEPRIRSHTSPQPETPHFHAHQKP